MTQSRSPAHADQTREQSVKTNGTCRVFTVVVKKSDERLKERVISLRLLSLGRTSGERSDSSKTVRTVYIVRCGLWVAFAGVEVPTFGVKLQIAVKQ